MSKRSLLQRLFITLLVCVVAILPVVGPRAALKSLHLDLPFWNAAATTDRSASAQPTPPNSRSREESAEANAREAYGSLPISFIANQGQTDSDVKFFARGQSYSMYLTGTEAVMVLSKRRVARKSSPAQSTPQEEQPPAKTVVRMKLEGANSNASLVALHELPGKSNYFIGNDPEKWLVGVPSYRQIKYEQVYSGVDMVFHGNQRHLEYDFVVAPGTDPGVIKLGFEGAQKLRINKAGDLVLKVSDGELRQRAPVIFQQGSDGREHVHGRFVLKNDRVGFDVGDYDKTRPLIIDPVLNYSTYIGGGSDDRANGVAIDGSGNAYVTGVTASTNFPVSNPVQSNNAGGDDVFVTKLNAAGTAVVYSTYIGGSLVQGVGGGDDRAYGIAVDGAGSAYITGSTTSVNFPTVNPLQSDLKGIDDAFVAKLNAAGSALVYSTYLGGTQSSIFYHDIGKAIAVDSGGNAYVAGSTGSSDFPVANPVQATNQGGNGNADGFVTKLNASGAAITYSTYLGGAADDSANAIALDSQRYAYVTGMTLSTNFPSANAAQPNFGGGNDAFVTKLSITGTALVYSTYLGGTGSESGNGIAVDSTGSAYITGVATNNFPTTAGSLRTSYAGGSSDGFVTKVSVNGSSWSYSTYLGGSSTDYGNAIAIDGSGNAFIVGATLSNNFPKTAGSISNSPVNYDAFVSKLNAAGSALSYSSLLGGNTSDDYGNAVTLSGSTAFVAGYTSATDFPITQSSFQPAPSIPSGGPAYDSFVAKIADVSSFNISGRLADGSSVGIGTNTITVTGSQTWTTQTDSNGNYWIGGLAAGGNYTVTPAADRYTVNPVNQTFNNLSANQTANFTGTLKTYTISGHVTNTGGGSLSGVSIDLSGSDSQSMNTNGSGNYSFTVAAAGTYTITPSLAGLNFTPETRTFSNLNANQTANFSAAYTISGQILNSSAAPLNGVQVNLTGSQTFSATTDGDGNYSFPNVQPQGNFTVTPTLTGYSFAPVNASFTNLSSSQTANFTGTTYSVSGQITGAVSGLPINGASITLSGSQTGFTTTNVSGNYSFPNLAPGGNYTLTPNKPGYSITPQTINNLSGNQTLNFTAATCAITGYVRDNFGFGLPTAQVSMSGSQTGSVFTNFQGFYSFNVPPGGTYTLTANYPGYTFNPSSQTFANVTTDQNYTFQAPPKLISGRVIYPDGTPSINTQMCISGSQVGCVLTNMSGDYHFNVALGGTYTITPSESWLAFIPANQIFANLSENQIADFTALDQNSIAGKVKSANQIGIPGVTVTLTGTQFATTQTDAGGNYYFQNLAQGGVYWVTPGDADLVFTPTSRTFVDCWGFNCGDSQSPSFTALANGIVPLNPTADAFVSAGSPTSNYGAGTNLEVQNTAAGPNSETYLTFDLAGIVGNVASAKLRLYGSLSDASATNVVTSFYSVASTDWIESGPNGTTWNTKPASGGSPIGAITVVDNVNAWYEVDLTAYIATEKIAGRNVVSVALKNAVQSPPATIYNSREAAANKPELVVTTAPVITQLLPNSGPIGTSVTITGDCFGATQAASTLTFNGISAAPTSWSNKSVTALVPAGAGTGPVVVTVNNVTSNSVTYTVTNNGTFAGKISRASDGTGITGAQVVILQGGVQVATFTTPSSGLYSIGNLLAGTYDLRASASGFGTVVQTGQQITSGATTTVNIALANAGTISGAITGPTAAAVSGAAVKVIQGANVVGTATTNGSGNYSVGSLGAGTYTIEVSASGFVAKSQTGVAVTAGNTTTVNLQLIATTATYRLHKENSTTSGLFQLKTAGPDGTSLAILSAELQSQATGEKVIKQFDTQAAVPNASGTILANSVVSFSLWMRKTASLGAMVPRAKVFLNSAAGTALCTATGGTALTTTLTKYTITCNTGSNITVTASDRFYVWVGVNLTTASSSGSFKGELDVEGTLNGNYDSLVTVPFPIPSPSLSSLTPSTGAIGSQVTINGSNFSATQSTSTVTFNGVQANVLSWNNTTIVTTVPIGAATGPVVVNVNGLASNSITFTVTGPGSIAGTITRTSDGQAINGALVEVLQYNVVKASASSAANGSYTVSGLQAGAYDVRVSASGFGTTVRSGNSVASGATTSLNVALTNTGTISGAITGGGGAISGATVKVHQGTTQAGTATTNGSGNYSVATLATGTYTVEVSATGYQTLSQSGVTVSAGSTTTLNLNLNAITGTYRLHNEASTSSGLAQLKVAGPDVASVAITSAELNGQPTGEKPIKEFDTQAGVPNASGLIPSGSTITFNLWMRKTANLGTMFPRAKVYLNNASGTLLCNVTGTTALTTTLTKYTLTGTTSSNIVVTPSDRFYLWTGVNLTVASSSGTFKGELDIEGTLNGNFDSTVAVPLPLAVPAISGITPGVGRVGDAFSISGVNFGGTQGASALTINGVIATALSWNNTIITATVPFGAATGPAVVTVNGLPSNGFNFYVDTSPYISSLSPTWGPVSTSVSVTGFNFGPTQGTSTIRFNGVQATPSSWGATLIVVPVPSGVVNGPVVVTVAGADSNGVIFKVSATTPPPDPFGVLDTNGAVNLKVFTPLEPSP